MAGIRLDGATHGVAEVQSTNNLTINLPTTLSQAGVMAGAAVVHDGAAGVARVVRALDVNVNRRVLAGQDSILFQDVFGYQAQNTAVWSTNTSGGAVITYNTPVIGRANFNSANVTGANSTQLTTYKMFPLFGGAGLQLEMDASYDVTPDATVTYEFGWFQATGTSAPTDGVLFRIASGIFYGVINVAGTETTVNLGFLPSLSDLHNCVIKIYQEQVEFWVDGVLYGVIVDPNTMSYPTSSMYQPICLRTIGTAGTVAAMDVGQISLYSIDLTTYRSWPQTMAGMGLMGAQWPSTVITAGSFVIGTTYIVTSIGSTNFTLIGGVNTVGTFFTATGIGAGTGTAQPTGTTAYYGNSIPVIGAGIALANATQATYYGLGGQFDIQPTLTANTDGILCYFPIPAGTALVPGKSLVITGIRIQGVVTTVLANTASLALEYSLAIGSTALSLATAEAANTKAYRRIPLGTENYGGGANVALGTLGSVNPIVFTPTSPIVVNQGEYVAIATKNAATVTTSGVITIIVTFDAHWE